MKTKTYYVFMFSEGKNKNYFSTDNNGNKIEALSTFARLEDLAKEANKQNIQLDIPDQATLNNVRSRYIPSKGIDTITLAELIAAEKSLSPN